MRQTRSGLVVSLLACATLLLYLPQTGMGQADEETRTRAQLARLQAEMGKLSRELESDLKQRDSLQAALRQSEKDIGAIRRDIEKTLKELEKLQGQLADMRRQRHELQVARGQQQELIIREIKAAYQMGKQGQLKILLNQERPDTMARAMAYYDYFYRARQDHIDNYLDTIDRINRLEPDIAAAAAQLQAAQETLDGQRQQLVAGKQQRERDLKKLNSAIVGKDRQLRQMGQDREELERLLEVIEQAIAEMQVPQEFQGFDTLKGSMPWPVRAKPSNRFGAKRSSSDMRWQGLVLPAAEGSSVSAIHHGRVVFADWFRGSGLLLIIDHGEGYMSLYANNQALLRDVGEWVTAGSAVATVGNSGGQRDAALYFEIRHNGKPVNPGSWLAGG
jgi:septal ring factor EnvC (AmiA/AmiB activator)